MNLDYKIFFRSMIGFRPDAERLYWIREQAAEVDIVDIDEVMEQAVTEVKIDFPVSYSTLTGSEEYIQ